jgi:hypothetical protein
VTDAELQVQYQNALRRAGTARRGCPSPEQMLQLVERTGSEEERLETLDHVMSCADCDRELALLQGIHAAQPPHAVLAPRQWLIAASLLIAFAGGVLLTRGVLSRQLYEPMRGARSASEHIMVVGATAPVGEGQPGALTWHPVPGAIQYTVEVLDASDRVVFTTQTADTTVTVPAMREPAAWWVRATLSDGTDRRSEIVRLVR